MNKKLEEFKKYIKGKHVLLLGVGVSNKPLIKMLLSYGAKVTACDKNQAATGGFFEEMKMGASFVLGENYLDNLDADIIFKTPGIREDIPQLVEAKRQGTIVTNEMEVFFEVCPCKIIAVTGSDGKTTTTTLIHNILTKSGKCCHLGGNIGKPLLPEIENINEEDIAVVELSSFQLMSMKQSPDIAVITNITPNHLDVHKSMEEYIEAKKNIFRFQKEDNLLVLNKKNDITASFEGEAPSKTVFFGGEDSEISLKGNFIYYGSDPILDINDILIPGSHNVENFMAAIGAVYGIADKDSIYDVAKNFKGVEHRIEFVKEIDGVRFYNDSIASSPTRARAGLHAFDKKVILIAGGYDKKIPFDDFGVDIKERVKRLYLIGDTAPKIKEAVLKACGGQRLIPIITQYTTMEAVVKEAYMSAQAGDIVLLSPACASFDCYKNFEERGKKFKELVKKL